MSSSTSLAYTGLRKPDQSQPPVEIVLRGLLNESLHHPTDRLRPLLWRRRRNAGPFEAGPRGLYGQLRRSGNSSQMRMYGIRLRRIGWRIRS